MSLDPAAGDASYGEAFFSGIDQGSRRSADALIPLLIELFSPESVVDVGAGAGHWAAACLARGVDVVLAVDGSWVPVETRAVPPDHFLEHDLAEPLELGRKYDLALCLETAEHLSSAAAPSLVQSLAAAAPVVAFSAAAPGQGGHGHINEQPASYWARLFDAHGYACFIDVRRRIWNDATIEAWYRQNLLCFVRKSECAAFADRLKFPAPPDDPLLDVAHYDFVLSQRRRADRLEAYADRLETEKQILQRAQKARQGVVRQRLAGLRKVRSMSPWRALHFPAGLTQWFRR